MSGSGRSEVAEKMIPVPQLFFVACGCLSGQVFVVRGMFKRWSYPVGGSVALRSNC